MTNPSQLLHSSSLTKRFLTGATWSLFGKIASAGATLTAYALLARLLTPDEMGSYFFVLSVVTFISMCCQWGFNRGLVKLVASELAKGRNKLVRSGIITSFGITVVFSFFMAAFLISPIGEQLLVVISGSELLISLSAMMGLWVIIKALQGLVSETFRGFHDIRLATIFGGLVTAVLSMVFYFLFWTLKGEASLYHVVQLMVLAAGLSLLFGFTILFQKVRVLDHGGKLAILKVLKFGFPLFITSISLFGVREFHLWVLAMFQPESEVAMYGSALRLVTLLAMPLIIVNSVIPPMIADLYSRKKYAQVQRVLQKTATLMSMPAIIVFCLIMLFGKNILEFIYGASYTEAYMPFIILAGGQMVNVLTGSPGVLLTMSGHEKVVMKSAYGAGALGLAISLIGVQYYGAVGAALGYSIGIVINNILMWMYSAYRMSIFTQGSLTSAINMLRRLRVEIESNDVNGGRLAFLGAPVAKIEQLWWWLRGYEIFECYGDSHVKVFRGLNHLQWIGKRRFRTVSVKGATAYGIGNPNSSTNALHIFMRRLNEVPKERNIIFMMGEVDVGFLVWLRAKNLGLSVNKCMNEAFQRYTNFLSDIKIAHPNIKVCSVPLPTISDNEAHGNVANARSGIDATQRERTQLTLEFNKKLKVWSCENKVGYYDFDLLALDAETKIVKNSLLNKKTSDHHYDNEAFYYLIKKVLNF